MCVGFVVTDLTSFYILFCKGWKLFNVIISFIFIQSRQVDRSKHQEIKEANMYYTIESGNKFYQYNCMLEHCIPVTRFSYTHAETLMSL